MNILRTDRTYKTHANALRALEVACGKVGLEREALPYFIATREVNGEVRFAPAIRVSGLDGELFAKGNALMFEGVTIF